MDLKQLRHICVAASLFGGMHCVAATSAGADGLEEITVVAARLPRAVRDVAARVDIIQREALLADLANNFGDIIRYTPGVSATTEDTRFAHTELSIRGLSGNRVVHVVDGIASPDQFDIGAFANAGHDYLIPDAVQRVELLRGPASTLFGSDALGGVMAIVTRSPEDFLRDGRAQVSALWDSRDSSATLNAGGAFALEDSFSGVIHLSHLQGQEPEHVADKVDRERRALMAKLIAETADAGRFALHLQGFEEQVNSDARSVLGSGRRYRNSTSIRGVDERRRQSGMARWILPDTGSWSVQGQVAAWLQTQDVEQDTFEVRGNATPPVAIQRRFSYRVETTGAGVDLQSEITTGKLFQQLGWGLHLERARVRESRDGRLTNLENGAQSNTLLGEVMPVRDFPETVTEEFALYLHDEMRIGKFSVIPAVRWERYALRARADAVFVDDNPLATVVDVTHSSWSPKLGVIWHPAETLDVYAQYAHGYRAPPFEDVNIGFDVPLFNYRALPNPQLEPEQSDSYELGVRGSAGSTRWSVTGFYSEYKDLIETRAIVGQDANGTLLFQSRNIQRATVHGIEFDISTSLSSAWRIAATGSWVAGKNTSSNEALNTLDPPELVTRLDWTPDDRARLSLIATAVAGRSTTDDSRGQIFRPGGYVALDVTASYNLSTSLRLDLGVFNLTDRDYWRVAAVRYREPGDPLLDSLAATGRSFSAAIRYGF